MDGWATRGLELRTVTASLDHHTAGAATGYLPSLKTLIGGRSDLPGPLCNGAAPRSEPGDFKVYVIAAGKANHAGAGLWNGADSNYECVGLERELVGNGSDVTPHRNEVAVRWHTAVCRLLGLPAKAVCRHAEYALPKGRKIDTAGVSGDWLRDQVAMHLHAPQEDDMTPAQEAMLRDLHAELPTIRRLRALFGTDDDPKDPPAADVSVATVKQALREGTG